MVALYPYPRGFVLHDTRTDPELSGEWPVVELPGTVWRFAHDPEEPVDLGGVPEGRDWILVYGLCLYCGSDDRDLTPAQRLAEASARGTGAFLDELDLMGGRHLVLRPGPDGLELYQDATGMRSVYFSSEAALIASHVHLINDLVPHEKRTPAEGCNGALSGWDRTPFLGIAALLPNHVLHPDDWSHPRFFPRTSNRYQDLTHQERLETFRSLWDRQMAELTALGSQLVMSLTGGADSRTSLALSMDHLDEVEMFTYTVAQAGNSTWSKSMDLDRQLVEQLKELVPMRHRYFIFGQQSHPEKELITQLLSKNTHGSHGKWLVSHYATAFPAGNVIHLRGNNYEIGRAYWGSETSSDTMADLQRLYLRRTKKDSDAVPLAARQADFRRGFIEWQYDTEKYGYHLFDLFYWEVRCGRWLTEILNETDIAFNTCVPLNCRAMIEISLAYSRVDRKSGFFFAELINAAHPVLNFPGKNDARNLYEQQRDTMAAQAQAPTPSLAPEETAAGLEPHLQIVTSNGQLRSLPGTARELWVPAREFLEGTVCSRTFQAAPGPCDLLFTLDAPYMYSKATGTWSYRLLVDDKPCLEWDGPSRRRPVHVAVAGLRPEHRVSIQAVVHRDRLQGSSWEAASRATVVDAAFIRTVGTHEATEPAVVCDIPAARVS